MTPTPQLACALIAMLALACSEGGGGVFVGSGEDVDKTPATGVIVGDREAGLLVGLERLTDEAPTEPTNATLQDTQLTINVTSYGTLDGGDGNCEQSDLAGYYFSSGEVLSMSYIHKSSLPALENAPLNLCGLYLVLEPRASGVTSGSAPAIEVELQLSDGRTIEFESNDHLFLIAQLDQLDPATATLALDPLAWFADIDLGTLIYDSDQRSVLSPTSQPELYAVVLARVALTLQPFDPSSQEP